MGEEAKIWRLEYEPSDKQRLFHSVDANQILYGGAAGGGKSHGIRMDGLLACLENPGLQGYLFRRTYPELIDNHIKQIKAMEIPKDIASWIETRRELLFHHGARMHFCFAENEDDIHRYQGAEMHWVGVDEAALMTEYQLKYIRTRVRLGSFKARNPSYFPRLVYGSNPGGPGHSFLRRVFIEQAPPLTIFRDKTTQSRKSPGWRSIYIPAKMDENPHLDVATYEGAFSDLTTERRKALRDGNWDVIAGAAFDMLDRNTHMLRPFTPPRHWTHFMAMDWGTAKPFSIGWWCVSEGALLKGAEGFPDAWLPPGALIRFHELYGWNGQANEGCRKSSTEVAAAFLEEEDKVDMPPMDFRVCDPQMWAESDGPSPSAKMMLNERIRLRQGRRDRKANYTTMVERLRGEEWVNEEGVVARRPMMYVTSNCFHWWRTVPTLTLDKTEPDKGPETTKQEDHAWDETGFAIAHFAPVRTEEDRLREDFEEIYMTKKSGDPYAVKLG